MKATFIIFLVAILQIAVGQEDFQMKKNPKFVKGELLISLSEDFFDFPRETYGAYVSFTDKNILQIDSLVVNQFRAKTDIIESEKVVSYKSLQKNNFSYLDRVDISFNPQITELFKKYGVYFIGRTIKRFSPQDTIPHYIFSRRTGKKLVKRFNANRYIIIKFTDEENIEKFASELRLINGIKKVNFNEESIAFAIPNDQVYSEYNPGQKAYMGPNIMNFENAWDIAKGDSHPSIRIAFIDRDFSNLPYEGDLSSNMNSSEPSVTYGDGQNHGTEVASVACAVTDNYDLMAGATWNSYFMTFIGRNNSEVVYSLEAIRSYLDDYDPDNDCYVVNISLGLNTDYEDIKGLCDDLYYNYGVLIVAAVGKDGTDKIYYPANYSSVIGVGASAQSDDELVEGTNFGEDVEVVATGEDIYVINPLNDIVDIEKGTSFAAPFVSSLCALILNTENGYYLSNDEIRAKIKSKAKTFTQNVKIDGWLVDKTFYRINAYNTINNIVTGISDEISITDRPSAVSQNEFVQYAAYFKAAEILAPYIVEKWQKKQEEEKKGSKGKKN